MNESQYFASIIKDRGLTGDKLVTFLNTLADLQEIEKLEKSCSEIADYFIKHDIWPTDWDK